MRTAALGALGSVLLAGCVRTNPAYGDQTSGSGPGATEGDTASSVGSVGTASTADSADASGTASTDASTSSGHAPGCGDGVLDPGEQCDDGNVQDGDGCLHDCTVPPQVDWVYEPPIVDGVSGRFNDVAVFGEVVIAAGRGAPGAGGLDQLRMTSLTRIDGAVLHERHRVEGSGAGAEIRRMLLRGGTVFFAGRSGEDGQYALVGRVGVDADGIFAEPSIVDISGSRAQGIAVVGDDIVVGSGLFDASGYGVVHCVVDPSFDCDGNVLPQAVSQIDDVGVSGDSLLASGLLDGHPFLALVDDGVPGGLDVLLTDEKRVGRLQSFTVRAQQVFAVGSIGTAAGESAWAVAFSLADEAKRWEVEIDGGSAQDDEFEDVAVMPDGDIVVVGMLGDPPLPVVVAFDGVTGELRWEETLTSTGGYASGHARAVAVEGEEIFVAGEWRQDYVPGDGTSTSGVGFVVRFVAG